MSTFVALLRVFHIAAAILMAWPFYALVVVNQRVRLGPPVGDRADSYMENIIRNRTIPCFVFQGTVLGTGLGLVLLRGEGLLPLVENAAVGLKFLLLLAIAGLLALVHFRFQPQIDALFAQAEGHVPVDLAPRIVALRGRRKRVASVCMFVVLTNAMLGVQAWSALPLWLTILLILAISAFTWRAYTSVAPFGWI